MKLPTIRPTDHGSEIALLSAIAVGVVLLLWRAIERGLVGIPVSAALWLALILGAIHWIAS